ncbi:ExeA family protein [Fuchsiella alkaliacetigena]|uniref:ExeA family protein n=1 Tax=Fuchsiella alkaliacetigena TaxID=957042 RepID=UPI00200AE0AC|nr:AAA family ATPase [Fuchsiella alkaliacetigena]MCK8824813.1 AAA family ATPase [Fuchsiella alkaliacetigena]
MYKSFYSLADNPFAKEIKTENLFPSGCFKEVSARIDYLKKTKGMGVIVGEPGSGKTSTLRAMANKLNPSLFKVIYFPLSTGTVMDFYRGLAAGLGEEPAFRKVDLFKQIQHAITKLSNDKKITPVFILDEIHLAANKFLNDLGILFNFSMDSENPFVLILAGLPFFMDKLSLNQNQSLNQRVIMRYHLKPLSKDEVNEYIEHQLQLAGASHSIFSPQAIEAICLRSRGLPRLINNLAVNSLLLGCQLKADTINEEIVFKACEEIGL